MNTADKVAVHTETKPKAKPSLHLASGSFVTFDLDNLPAAKKLLDAALDTLGENDYATYLSGDAKTSMNVNNLFANAATMRREVHSALEREAAGLSPVDWGKLLPGGR